MILLKALNLLKTEVGDLLKEVSLEINDLTVQIWNLLSVEIFK